MKVLAIGSHFDDVEIGCGGSLLRHRDAGDEIHIAIINSDDPLGGSPALRYDEQVMSLDMLGAVAILGGDATDEVIISRLDALTPDIIYLPYKNDYHSHHYRAHMIGMSVARKFTADVFQYIVTTSYDYWPNGFRLINLEEKLKLVSLFKSQMERRPEYITILKQQHQFFRSFLNGEGDAEGFIIQRMLIR